MCETWVCLFGEHQILTGTVALFVCLALVDVARLFANAWVLRGRSK